jgi:spore coat protein CotH
VNIDRFITFWALETLLEHTDGYTAGANNFYVYFDPQDGGQATFIPWGTDAVMSEDAAKDQEREPGSFGAYVRGELARRLSRVPEASMKYQVELRRLLDEVWVEEEILASIDAYAHLVRSAETSETYDEHLNVLRAWVSHRRAQVEDGLAHEIAQGHEDNQICEEGAPGLMIDLVGRFGFAW